MSPVLPRVSRELDRASTEDLARYERAFFQGFGRATHNRLVRQLWDWDLVAGRVRTRIPYEDQRIWVLDHAGAIDAAIAVNVALRQLQGAAYGFGVPPELEEARAGGRLCEFLTFFAVAEHDLARKRALWRELFADLRACGFDHALATCSPKVLALYRWMGAQERGRVEIAVEPSDKFAANSTAAAAEIRHFLVFDLRRVTRT